MLHCTPKLSQSLGAVSPFRSFVVTLSAWVSHVMLHVFRYIAFVVDGSESELGILDLIQVFVESLDKSFQNVCELHLIFHSDQVRLQTCWYPSLVWSCHCPFCSCGIFSQAHYILDEIVMGMLLSDRILKCVCNFKSHALFCSYCYFLPSLVK